MIYGDAPTTAHIQSIKDGNPFPSSLDVTDAYSLRRDIGVPGPIIIFFRRLHVLVFFFSNYHHWLARSHTRSLGIDHLNVHRGIANCRDRDGPGGGYIYLSVVSVPEVTQLSHIQGARSALPGRPITSPIPEGRFGRTRPPAATLVQFGTGARAQVLTARGKSLNLAPSGPTRRPFV